MKKKKKSPKFFEIWNAYRYGEWCKTDIRSFLPSKDKTVGDEIWWNYRPAVIISNEIIHDVVLHAIVLPITNFLNECGDEKKPTYYSEKFEGYNITSGYIKCDQVNSFSLEKKDGNSYLHRWISSGKVNNQQLQKISGLVRSYFSKSLLYLFTKDSLLTNIQYRFQKVIRSKFGVKSNILDLRNSMYCVVKDNINLCENEFEDISTGAIIAIHIEEKEVICVVISKVNELGIVTLIQAGKLNRKPTKKEVMYYPLTKEETRTSEKLHLFLYKIRSVDIKKRKYRKVNELNEDVIEDIFLYLYNNVICLESIFNGQPR